MDNETNMPELETARKERDELFTQFVEESSKATKHSLKAIALRNKYRLANAEVKALEVDYLTTPIV